MVFSTAYNRKSLVIKLLRAFFSYEDMMGVGSLEELPNSNKIIGAILGKPKLITMLLSLRTGFLHNAMK